MISRPLTLFTLSAALTVSPLQAIEWSPSDPPGGTAVSLVGDGSGTVWVATEGGGVFRSTDGGAIWTAKNAGLESRATAALERAVGSGSAPRQGRFPAMMVAPRGPAPEPD